MQRELDAISAAAQTGAWDKANRLADVALRAHPDSHALLRAKAIVLRLAGRRQAAQAHLEAVLARFPGAAWAHAQMAATFWQRENARAVTHLRAALALDSGSRDYRLQLAAALMNVFGDGEGEALDEAYGLLSPLIEDTAGWTAQDLFVAYNVLSRVCAFDRLEKLGDVSGVGRRWAKAGMHFPLLLLLGKIVPSVEAQPVAWEPHGAHDEVGDATL